MATQDTSTDESILEDDQEEVETEETQEDETQEDSDDIDSDDDTEDDDSEEDDGSDDEEESDEDESEFTKAFSQIKGDTLEEYTPNLEEAYRKSSREGRKLSQEKRELQERVDLVASLVAKHPELAKAIEDAEEGGIKPLVDPALEKVRSDLRDVQEKEYQEFEDSHPQITDDEDLRNELFDTMKDLANAARNRGKTLGMTQALKKAWSIVGDDDEAGVLAEKAKETASKKKSGTGGKKSAQKNKTSLSPEQIAMGKRLGLSEKQLIENANR